MSATPKRPLGPEPTCAPPVPNPKKPDLALPPKACDAHYHIFGPAHRFPFAADRTFTPHDAPLADLLALHRHLGFERGVFVQSACHGTDHSAVLDALAGLKDRYRGVALLTPSTPPAEVARLHEAGFRGVRLHFVSHLHGQSPDDIRAVIRLVAPFGWHIAVHTMHDGLAEHEAFIRAIDAPVVIDHIGRFDIADGESSRGFQALRRLLDGGRVWVKLSGVDRLSDTPPCFRDAVAVARILAAQAPERILWGTDWPHPNHKHVPDDGVLVDLIAEIAPDETIRRKMLVDNPAALFGFE
ncbi:amidohydrolase family protein [Rhodoplanes sp. TEM]|uniref:Amidohydrolase family protein n=1 Tax=Rhodoplanes tepidamans TaxID=200616 RepID=A0ABT5JCJ6_RHOTP|nr:MULTISPECIES: amidohydrolase family protein [Rhodoplanes]MDC7787238.1 amidohydrolase family protein [Rhodoplanes tepidamans]MDC7986583.1 amidohydrolase family protein [Rhodoplanes sp. TEM]MDQ0357773.1 putative TIM-barrel fold metal-dependent hydrolase [Rhodoplanes tepidamans]